MKKLKIFPKMFRNFSENGFSKNIFRHDENKIFVQLFFCYLDYVSRVLENHLEHPGAASELTRAVFFLGCVKKICGIARSDTRHPVQGESGHPSPAGSGSGPEKMGEIRTGSTGTILSRPPLGVGGCKFEDNMMKHVA